MNSISEVTAAPGKDCDFIFLHFRGDVSEKYSRVTIKTFMDPLRLLQARLTYLVDNSQENDSIGEQNPRQTCLKLYLISEAKKN